MQSVDIQKYENLYRNMLLDDVIPFWEKYSIDREFGGYFTCLERDGKVYDTDKFIWLQARQVWTFSMLYNQLEKRSEWLQIARHGAEFLHRRGQDANGDWYFALERTGKPLVAAYNIFSDCFATLALMEYSHAAQEDWAREIGVKTYWRIQDRRENPKGRFNKEIPGTRNLISLSLPMITIGMTHAIHQIAPSLDLEKVINENLALVLNLFVDSKQKIVFENIFPDGSHSDSFAGRLLNPGHVLEAMWFMMEVGRARNDRQLIQKTAEVMCWTIERGWDEQFGGIFYFLDQKGYPSEKLEWDMKLWWVHLEALYAFLLAHHLTGEAIFESWFHKIHDYTWAHFPDPKYGEWFGYLNRRGEVTNSSKGGKWKGCFHVPRALYLCAKLFGEMNQKQASALQI